MPSTALYTKGNRAAPPYRLSLTAKSWGTSFPKGIQLSKKAFKHMDNRNLLPQFSAEEDAHFLDQRMGFPSLLIRPVMPAQNHLLRAYITQQEFEEVSAHFELPADMLNDAFFIRAGRSGNIIHNIVPRWSELFDPQWRKDFLCWIAGTGDLPSPSEIPWETLKYGLIAMPTYLSALCLGAGKNIKNPLSGRLVLSESPPRCFAKFHYKVKAEARSAMYSLGPDKFERIQATLTPEESFDKRTFLKIFGPNPQLHTYNCSRKAGKNGAGFGNVQGLTFTILPGNVVPIIEGELYYFDFIRRGNTLEIKCYTDPERKHLYGWFNLGLNFGFPRFSQITLLKSEK